MVHNGMMENSLLKASIEQIATLLLMLKANVFFLWSNIKQKKRKKSVVILSFYQSIKKSME